MNRTSYVQSTERAKRFRFSVGHRAIAQSFLFQPRLGMPLLTQLGVLVQTWICVLMCLLLSPFLNQTFLNALKISNQEVRSLEQCLAPLEYSWFSPSISI